MLLHVLRECELTNMFRSKLLSLEEQVRQRKTNRESSLCIGKSKIGESRLATD